MVACVKDFAVCGREADGEPIMLRFCELLRFEIAATRGVIADDLVFVQ